MKYDPNVAYIIDKIEIPEEVALQVSDLCKQNPVRNLGFDYLHFVNSSVFSPAANTFNENKANGRPAYTLAIPGTNQYKEFWQEEWNRCVNGYTVGGVYITGEHYFYLNYSLIEKEVRLPNGYIQKELTFPDFITLDYYWYLQLEKTENPIKFDLPVSYKQPLILGKARRKGWSFKNAAGAAWIYTFFKNTRTLVLSQEGDKSEYTFKMAINTINHLNEYTEFRQPTLVNRQDMIQSGWIERVNGQDVTKGKKNIIEHLSLKDSPDKSAGRSLTRLIFEEAGQIRDLKKAYRFAEPTIRSGEIYTGIALIYGTGGDMDNATQDFASMFYNPDSFGIKSFENIYEKNEQSKESGLFVSEMWFRPGAKYVDKNNKTYEAVDKNGNVLHWVAELALDEEREKAKGTSKTDYEVLLTQKCKTPSEAFLKPEGNVFPTAMIYDRITYLMTSDRYKRIATPGKFEWTKEAEKPVKFIPDLKSYPIWFYPHKHSENTESAVLIYEAPPLDKFSSELYKIGVDPVRFSKSGGKSLASILVYKQFNNFEQSYDVLVAEYTGRFDDNDKIAEIALQLSLYYNKAEVMVENEAGQDMFNYFRRKGYEYLLARQPDSVIAKAVTNSKMNRVFGAPMNDKMKEYGEKRILTWLLEERGTDEHGKKTYNLDYIPSIGLLQELLSYTRFANCDRVMALMQVLFLVEENSERAITKTVSNNIASTLLKRLENK
jgi:hypothetical protein